MSISQPNAYDAWPFWRLLLKESDRAGSISGGPQYFTIQPYDSMT